MDSRGGYRVISCLLSGQESKKTINLSGAPGALSSVSKVAGIFMINENYSGSSSRSAQIGLYPELVLGFDMKRKRGCNL